MKTKKPPRTPSFRHHKASGQGFVELDRRQIYLGRYDRPETRERYHRLIAEWESNGRRLCVDASDVTVVEVMAAFVEHAEQYYRAPDGRQSSEPDNYRQALRPVERLYAGVPAVGFGPKALRAIQQEMVKIGWCRKNINQQINRVRSVFRWAASQEMIPASICEALRTVSPLKRGRTDARESVPVKPVPDEHVEAVRSRVSRQVRALIDLQLLTGSRPGELVRMRPLDLDTGGNVWTFSPADHKCAHHGHTRTIYLGPKAQQTVKPFLAGRPVDSPLFSPSEAEIERRERVHESRKTPMSCGNRPGTNCKRNPKRKPGDCYDIPSYRRAIQRACDDAGVPRWSPNRLRHNAATRLRREFGIDLAQTILGHRLGSAITEIYAECNTAKAIEVVRKTG